MGFLKTSRVTAGAFSAADRRVRELANIAFGREVTRKVIDAILPLNDIGSGLAFYCVHGVTGCATDFRSMAEMLSPSVKFYGIQAPTVKRNAAFAASIEHMSRYYANRLNEFQPTGPLILGGHSVGAAIALEMAQQLRGLGRDVQLLIVFDGELFNTRAEISVFNPVYWIKLILNVPAWIRDILMVQFTFSNVVARTKSKIARLTGKRAGDAVEGMIDLRNFTPDHAAFVKTLFKSQFEHVPKKYLGRVVVCVAKTQPLTHLFQVEATWRKIAPAAEVVEFEGTHTSLVHPPSGLAVAEYLTGVLSQIDEAIRPPTASFGNEQRCLDRRLPSRRLLQAGRQRRVPSR
jgi:thioesterase domain-containing protein